MEETYRPSIKFNDPISLSITTGVQPASGIEVTPITGTKVDSMKTIAVAQDVYDIKSPEMVAKKAIEKAKEMPDAATRLKQIASSMASNSTSTDSVNYFIPPVSNFLGSSIGQSGGSILNELNSTVNSLNNLIHFTHLDTESLRQFVQIFRGIPGIQGLESMPYFKPLSESIGSSITFLTDASGIKNTDWISNASSTLGQTTPISKLNRCKLHPPILKNIEKAHTDLNASAQLNLGQLQSQFNGFIQQFSGILGFLPHEVTAILGEVTGILGQAQSSINQVLGLYSKIVSSSHGLDMIVDIAHLQRVQNNQSQMLNKLTDQFGDQLRMLQNIHPAKSFVKTKNSIVESDIHGYPTVVNLLGDKLIRTKFDNEVLKAFSSIL